MYFPFRWPCLSPFPFRFLALPLPCVFSFRWPSLFPFLSLLSFTLSFSFPFRWPCYFHFLTCIAITLRFFPFVGFAFFFPFPALALPLLKSVGVATLNEVTHESGDLGHPKDPVRRGLVELGWGVASTSSGSQGGEPKARRQAAATKDRRIG